MQLSTTSKYQAGNKPQTPLGYYPRTKQKSKNNERKDEFWTFLTTWVVLG